VLERARYTLCLATGPDKAESLKRVLKGPSDPFAFPSQIASPDTAWYIDKAAATQL
jgi:6-phosphogluconolactonase/glucosamine-6-phosphate isomerase/deaminase